MGPDAQRGRRRELHPVARRPTGRTTTATSFLFFWHLRGRDRGGPGDKPDGAVGIAPGARLWAPSGWVSPRLPPTEGAEICGPGVGSAGPQADHRRVNIRPERLQGTRGAPARSGKNDPRHQGHLQQVGGTTGDRRGWASAATTPGRRPPAALRSFPGGHRRLGPLLPEQVDGIPGRPRGGPARLPAHRGRTTPSPPLQLGKVIESRPPGVCVRQHVVGRGLTGLTRATKRSAPLVAGGRRAPQSQEPHMDPARSARRHSSAAATPGPVPGRPPTLPRKTPPQTSLDSERGLGLANLGVGPGPHPGRFARLGGDGLGS